MADLALRYDGFNVCKNFGDAEEDWIEELGMILFVDDEYTTYKDAKEAGLFNDIIPKFVKVSDLLMPMLSEDEKGIDSGFYVLTTENNQGRDGAVAMCCLDKLNDILDELGEPFYILPSSIHEVLILPVSKCGDQVGIEQLTSMVYTVNRSEVEPNNRLSDSLFYFGKGLPHPIVVHRGGIPYDGELEHGSEPEEMSAADIQDTINKALEGNNNEQCADAVD